MYCYFFFVSYKFYVSTIIRVNMQHMVNIWQLYANCCGGFSAGPSLAHHLMIAEDRWVYVYKCMILSANIRLLKFYIT